MSGRGRAALGGVVLGASALAASCGGKAATRASTATSAEAAVTYYKQVKPLVETKCAPCHHVGGFAPFPLEKPEDATGRAALIKAAVTSRTMPPWLTASSCADYEGDRTLTDEEIATFARWADQGAALGAEADYAAPPPVVLKGLSRTDVSLASAVPFTPTVQPDEYRCFVLDWPKTADTFVTGFSGVPDAVAEIHHIIAFVASPDQAAHYRALDDADPGPGYECFGGSGGNALGLGAWAPGANGGDFPAGLGIPVQGNSKIIIQVHYNTLTTAPAPDRTAVAFAVADRVDKPAFLMPFTDPKWVSLHTMPIAAGDTDAVHTYEGTTDLFVSLSRGIIAPGAPLTLYSAQFHMHTRGTIGKLTVDHASGEKECLLDIARWNFHWQEAYRFKAPKHLAPGDTMRIECHWDNGPAHQPLVNGAPARPTDLNWGEGTTDEMCLGGVLVTQ